MSEPDSFDQADGGGLTGSLRRSLFAVCCILGFCVLLCIASAVLFVLRFQQRDEFGELLRDEPGAGARLIGHALFTVIGAVLAWCLWRYFLAVHRMRTFDQREFQILFRSLARWWYAVATSVVLFVLYAAWVVFVTGPGAFGQPL